MKINIFLIFILIIAQKNEFLLHEHLRINLTTTFLFLFYFIDILVYFHDALLQCARQLFINLSLRYI